MSLSSSLKLASFLAAIACLAAASGCSDGPDDGTYSEGPPPGTTTPTAPTQVPIDTNATVTVTPGQGVGVFVEYAAGGKWTITTACDTSVSQTSCGFDLFVSGLDPSTTLTNPQGSQNSDSDAIEVRHDGSIHFSTQTSTNLDGLTFSAPPGATIELATFLDGSMYDAAGNLQSRFVYWIGNGILHTGAPTDPVDFTPTMD